MRDRTSLGWTLTAIAVLSAVVVLVSAPPDIRSPEAVETEARAFPPLDLLVGDTLPTMADGEVDPEWFVVILQMADRGQLPPDPPPGPAGLPTSLEPGEATRLGLLPRVFGALAPGWRSASWGPEGTSRAQGTADLLAECFGAPAVRFLVNEPAANQESLERLADWFEAAAGAPERLAAMLSPARALLGVPVAGSAGRSVVHEDLPGGVRIETRVVKRDAGPPAASLVGRRSGEPIWSILLTDKDGEPHSFFLLDTLEVRDLGVFGWRAEVLVAGVPLHAYLAPDGRFLFYVLRQPWIPEERRTPERAHLRALVQRGRLAELDRRVTEGVDATQVEEDGETLLHVAAGGGHLDVVERLLELGLDPRAQDQAGIAPIHLAALRVPGFSRPRPPRATGSEHLAIVELFLKRGVPVDIGAGTWGTPLHAAAQVGCLETARLLLARGASPSDLDFLGETPLHTVASSIAQAEEIRERGLEPDFLGVARLLLAEGAPLEPLTAVGGTPLEQAAGAGARELVEELLAKGARADLPGRANALFQAASKGRLAVVERLLLEAGVDPLVRGSGGRTALHAAALGGDPAIATLLLERGLEVAARDGAGDTPLHSAALMGHLDMVRFLLDRGADVEAVNDEGWNALHAAASGFDVGETLLRLLVERGLDIHGKTKDGKTPLAIAVEGDEGGFFSSSTDDRLRELGATR